MLARSSFFSFASLLCAALSVVASGSASAQRLVVLHKSEASLGVYDPVSGERELTIETGVGPHEVAIADNGHLAVVADYGQRTPGNTLTVCDLEAGKVLRKIDLGENGRPHGIQFLHDAEGKRERRVVVTTEASRKIHVVDVLAGKVEKSIETASAISHMVALAPAGKHRGRRAYVANIGSGSMTAVDLELGRKLVDVQTGGGAEAIAVSPDGKEVWVGNRGADTLTVIDADTLEVKAELECGQFPIRLAFSPDGKHALISCANTGDVAVFDVEARKETQRIKMKVELAEDLDERLFAGQFGQSPVPVGLQVNPQGTRAFVANTQADMVTVIDLAQWTVVGRIATGKEPDGMAWTPWAPTPRESPEEGGSR